MAKVDSIPLSCETIIPDPAAPLESVVSRWSNSEVRRPAIVVIPDNEEDIIGAIRYAKEHGLTVIPAGGGHGSFLPIDSKTLYLDLKKFGSVKLDKQAGLVSIGGGAVTREVIRVCCAEGYYTTWPNSNAVGMVGCMLGGGNDTLTGVHGLMIDNVVSFRLITAEGKLVEVSESSTGDERALFNTLCGAGHGLGVVTSMTMKMFRMADLNMDDDKIWARRLIFPPTAIYAAAEAFLKLLPPRPNVMAVMAYMRSPPGTPAPGSPMIMLTASCIGPSADGETASALLFDATVTGKAIKAETVQIPFVNANAAFEVLNVHGDYKDIASCFVKKLEADSIVAGFEKWVQFTDTHGDTKRTMTVLGGWNTDKLVELGQTAEGQAKFSDIRDRGISMLTSTCYTNAETKEAMAEYQREMLALHRRDDPSVPRTFANNMLPWTPHAHLYSDEKIAEMKRVKKVWDGNGLFWSPYGEKA
ncbi:6-hydroxy-D-nicotine oxidase [Pleurostoma richardsiae]|uniref:6-hydroxy-D-nicotine oxidase n=1 Tax=Pleurostoma richardsiae TaxID=41990 RepID=A0AA38RFW9_9PEZI|nr:6-hydroxy-D-nicotine oxidase [Pleurostoma richardsiae]